MIATLQHQGMIETMPSQCCPLKPLAGTKPVRLDQDTRKKADTVAHVLSMNDFRWMSRQSFALSCLTLRDSAFVRHSGLGDIFLMTV